MDASKNLLTTGSLSFSDIQNQSHYDVNSSGFNAGVTTGAAHRCLARATTRARRLSATVGVAMQNLISALPKSGMGSFGWSGTGVWTESSGLNLFSLNNVPAIGAGVGGAEDAEVGTKVINDAKSRVEK